MLSRAGLVSADFFSPIMSRESSKFPSPISTSSALAIANLHCASHHVLHNNRHTPAHDPRRPLQPYPLQHNSILQQARHNRCSRFGYLSSSPFPELIANSNRYPDHVGGHIKTSTWVPSSSLDARMPELLRTLKDKEKVVFHCVLSQQRGPSAALRYARERERMLGADSDEFKAQEVYVLDGGFVKWQEDFGKDERLTEGYVADIWEDDY